MSELLQTRAHGIERLERGRLFGGGGSTLRGDLSLVGDDLQDGVKFDLHSGSFRPSDYSPCTQDRTMKIAKLGRVDYTDVLWALKEWPDLWDQNTARTADPTSPHHGLSDIWARFAAPGVDGSQPHESVWYESGLTLPLTKMAQRLMQLVSGTKLGGVLITRIPAGKECLPHNDPGWHAREYEKIAVQIRSAPGQVFHFEGQHLETKPGDVFWFDNFHTHWVVNPTEHERITAIFCIKTKAFEALKERD